ncbi:hypothetical protein RF11_01214 [Thelohanellus kitauei]|uniref:Uncharacterized protein n=1 Tax=Thelohanellus kitauei TaxID=669202 RepID=A0A0C2IDE2_THEKT|nr:hypothetical protein RF11_01214 [Thelohanellus kitauei]
MAIPYKNPFVSYINQTSESPSSEEDMSNESFSEDEDEYEFDRTMQETQMDSNITRTRISDPEVVNSVAVISFECDEVKDETWNIEKDDAFNGDEENFPR